MGLRCARARGSRRHQGAARGRDGRGPVPAGGHRELGEERHQYAPGVHPARRFSRRIARVLGACLAEFQYQPKLVDNKIHQIVEACLKELQTLNRPFKYIVTCIIMQKNGAGLDTGAALFWDNAKDGLVCIPWENSQMSVVVTVFGTALNVDNLAELD